MSYRLLSTSTGAEHDLTQWRSRTLQGELDSFEGRTLTRIFDRFLGSGPADVIEAGCGLGAWCEWFARRGHRVIGIEKNPRALARAKECKPDVPVEQGDVTDLRYPSDSFDAYVSLGVIEHFEGGADEVLEEAHRVLRPGGLAFISTPAQSVLRRLVSHPLRSLYFRLRRLMGRPGSFWEYRFTRDELVEQVERAGFEILAVEVDDYETDVHDHHIGLCADWFFLRARNGGTWELNLPGRLVLAALRILPRSWYASATLVVGRARK